MAIYFPIRGWAGSRWYKPPVSNSSTITRASAVVESPVYRGWGPIKPYDIVLNVDLKTVVNGDNFKNF